MTRREFSPKTKVAAFKRSGGRCEKCTSPLYVGRFRYDHILPDQLGGEPTLENLQVICSACDAEKTYRSDIPNIARAKRREAKFLGAARSGRPMPGSRASGLRKRMDGSVVRRDP